MSSVATVNFLALSWLREAAHHQQAHKASISLHFVRRHLSRFTVTMFIIVCTTIITTTQSTKWSRRGTCSNVRLNGENCPQGTCTRNVSFSYERSHGSNLIKYHAHWEKGHLVYDGKPSPVSFSIPLPE